MAKTMMSRLCHSLFVAVMVTFVACGDADMLNGDFGIEGEVKPEFTLPIAHGSLSLWDVLDTEDNVYLIVSNDTLVFVYSENNIVDDMKVEDFFDVSSLDISIETEPITLPNMNIVLPVPVEVDGLFASTKIEFTEGVELTELDFWANFKVEIPALDFDYKMEIKVEELYMADGSPFTIEIDGKKGTSYIYDEYLEFDARFVNDPIFHIKYNVFVPAGEIITGTIDLSMSLTDMDYKFAVGDFSEMEPVKIDEGTFSLGSIEFLEEIGGSFKFLDPEVSLKIRNCGIGVPFFADIKMTATNKDGDSADLKLKDGYSLIIPANSNPDETVTSAISFNNENSTIVDFFALPPIGDVTYEGTLGVVKHEKKDTIWHTASIGMDVDVRVPFALEAEGMNYSDTITDISLSDVDMLESGAIKLVLENEIPLNLTIPSLRLLDANNNLLTSISASGDGGVLAGTIGNPVKSSVEFVLTPGAIETLTDTEAIALDIVLSTDGEAVVMASQELKFKLIVTAKADLSDIID